MTGVNHSSATQPNRVEISPGGLNGIVDGLERLRHNQVSGVKLVAHPQEARSL